MSQQSMIDAAKAPILAYGDKDWNKVMNSVTPGILYDEVATHLKARGVDQRGPGVPDNRDRGWQSEIDAPLLRHGDITGAT